MFAYVVVHERTIDDVAVAHADLPGCGLAQREADRFGGEVAHDGVVGVDEWCLRVERLGLGRRVGLKAAVPIEVIVGEVEDDSYPWPKR